jgi:exopolyphosphatase/guanosine-5'-triphosphate,3'-diphosphate pyrophosphatase
MTSAAPVDEVVGFMDIGTNSLRLLLVRITPNHAVKVITQQKEVVRLGEGEFHAHHLQPAAMERAALVCRKFADLARSYGATELHAVATSATREAANQAEFLRLVHAEAALDVRVISGKEEARLIYQGVSSGIHLGEKRALFIDIGGGSTELSVGDQHQYYSLDSLKLGALRLTMLFLPQETGPLPPAVYRQLQRHIRDTVIRAIQSLASMRIELAVGSSGTILNLADIAMRMYHNRRRTRDDILTHEQLKEVVAHLCSLPLEERRRVPGINPERADIIVAGAAIIDTLMEELALPELRLSERGVQDGLLIDYLTRSEHAPLLTEMSVRERSILQLGRICHFDEGHARQVARLACALFDEARTLGLHTLGPSERELLEYAALLHDIGAFLSYTNHHAHSYYFIRNADLLGFDLQETALIATTTFFHRKPFPRKRFAEFTALDDRGRELVTVLCVLLRLAESLDRSHAGHVDAVHLHLHGKKTLVLTVATHPESQLELWGVQSHDAAVLQVFSRHLRVETIERESE